MALQYMTQEGLDKLKKELAEAIAQRPVISAAIAEARDKGDLSENAEYHAAKRERGKNESRIRYLRNMIKTAKVIDTDSKNDEIGLFDTVTYYVEEDDCEEQVRIVTTLRQNSMAGIISKESPLGAAIMGKKVNDRVFVKVNDGGYHAVIKAITKGEDDESLEIRKF